MGLDSKTNICMYITESEFKAENVEFNLFAEFIRRYIYVEMHLGFYFPII